VCFANLQKLDCSCNYLFDLIDLEMCHSIQNLNLEQNEIEDEDNIVYLSSLLDLKCLNLNKNPIQKSNSYQSLVRKYLTRLEILDERSNNDDKHFKDNNDKNNTANTSKESEEVLSNN
jgi:hypothetical protein